MAGYIAVPRCDRFDHLIVFIKIRQPVVTDIGEDRRAAKADLFPVDPIIAFFRIDNLLQTIALHIRIILQEIIQCGVSSLPHRKDHIVPQTGLIEEVIRTVHHGDHIGDSAGHEECRKQDKKS